MLTMPQQLPVKRLALYGSAAMVVGFVSTFGLLRQFAPKASPSGLAVVETINKKPPKTTANGVGTKPAEGKTAPTPALLDQSEVVISNGSFSAQQYPWAPKAVPTVAPTTTPTQPAPVSSTPVVSDNTTNTTQPAATSSPPETSTSSETTAPLPDLQETITDTNIINVDEVKLP